MAPKKIIIVGGLSAGPSAAAKARRSDEQAEIHLFEKTNHISYATCGIPYALSGKIQSRDKLMVVQPELLQKRFGIHVHLNEAVTDINPDLQIVYTENGAYQYDKLIFATGGHAVLPPIENIENFENWAHAKTIEDFDRIMKGGILNTADHITIVGAGLIGLETAENLIHLGKKVTVIELSDQPLAHWDKKFGALAGKIIQENGINLQTGVSIYSVNPLTNELTLSNGETLYTDFVLIAVSIKPNTNMLTSKGAKHLPNGALIVNDKMETSLPNIYAAGDCASIENRLTGKHDWFPMGTHSNKGGRTAGANATNQTTTFAGGYGTAIMKLFDYTIARTGMNAKTLEAEKINFKSSFTITGTTPGFYPEPKDLFLEIYFEPETGKLLGAEMIGQKGVDKRVDVFSTAIYAGLTIYDLPNLDLAYAPPFSPAKDPVIVAGFVAQNSLKGLYREISVNQVETELKQFTEEEITLLDVRNSAELHKSGLIEGAINIPLDDLRVRLEELNREKPIFVYCAKGMRGYLASLILHHHGFKNISNIAGGFTAWENMIGKTELV